MAGSGVPHRRFPVVRCLAIAAGCWAALTALDLAGAFSALDLRLHDWRYRLRGPLPASRRIALVEVDDATIAAYGSWPLPRQTYALLITALEAAGAQAVGFDLLFLGSSAEEPLADRLLASVTAGRTNLVHAISFMPGDAWLGGGGAAPLDTREQLIRHGRPYGPSAVPAARRVSLPYPALLAAADALGHTSVVVDRDGAVRRIPQYVRYGDWVYPALAMRLVECAARTDTTLPQFEIARDGLWMHRAGSARRRVPTDANGSTAIVFAGDRDAFPNSVPMLEALQWYRDGDTTSLRRAFAGRLVLVGATAVGEVATDVGAMPFGEAVPLVYIHANALDAALAGRYERTPPAWTVYAALLALASALAALLAFTAPGLSAALAAGTVLLVGAADQALFLAGGWDVPAAGALLLPALTWAAVEGFRRVATERDERVRQRELAVARTIQRGLLPERAPDSPGFDVAGFNLPAEAVGGDYYDWLALGEDSLAVALADVSGHGVPAALLMAHLRASFHAEARPGASPREVTLAMHASLVRAVAPGRFATFFLAVLSRAGPGLCFCNAGHNPALLVRGGEFERLSATGLPLAMMPDAAWTEEPRPFAIGDLLVIYSDGVTECPHRREQYGEQRLEAQVLRLWREGASALEVQAALLADLRTFAHGDPGADDVTLVVVRRR